MISLKIINSYKNKHTNLVGASFFQTCCTSSSSRYIVPTHLFYSFQHHQYLKNIKKHQSIDSKINKYSLQKINYLQVYVLRQSGQEIRTVEEDKALGHKLRKGMMK